jgi:hypothetical protein
MELSRDEQEIIAEALRREYQDLREEIVKTEDTHYVAMLHERERKLGELLSKFDPTTVLPWRGGS